MRELIRGLILYPVFCAMLGLIGCCAAYPTQTEKIWLEGVEKVQRVISRIPV